MSKVRLEQRTVIYPMPTFLIGAVVDGRPNFMTAAWSGIAASNPPAITVGIQPHRHTLKGIRQNLTFSVNVPSEDQVKEMDYCGIVSGSKVDKVAACGFELFYGSLETAPMIEQCPVNLECKVIHMLDLGSHQLVIGQIVDTFTSEDCLTDGRPDAAKVRPLVFAPQKGAGYQKLGGPVAAAFSVGKELPGYKKG